MSNEIDQGLHEKLCAYILGEASADVRAGVERELAASAELRAERETLERTIGLVQGAMAGSESLSRSASEILADARTPKVRPWYSRPALPIAASIAAATLVGLLVYRATSKRSARADQLAQLSPTSPTVRVPERAFDGAQKRTTDAEKEDGLLAYADKNADTPADSSLAARSARAEPPVIVMDQTGATAIGIGTGGERSNVTVETLEQLDSIRGGEQLGAKLENLVAERQLDAGEAQRLRNLGYADGSHPPTTSPQAAAGEIVNFEDTSDDFFVGQGAARKGQASTTAVGRDALGPASGGPSGPSSPAPGGPYPVRGQGGRLADGNNGADFFRAQKSQEQYRFGDDKNRGRAQGDELRARLSGLGYAGSDEDDVRGRDLSVFDGVRRLSHEDRERWIESECHRIVTSCRRRPDERPRDMFFRFWGDNPFELPALDPLSTFSVDVDTASYTLARRYLNEGNIPTKAQIRTEEFVNYFKADVPAPTEGTFVIHTDLAPSRFSSDKPRSLLRIVVRGKEVAKEERKPLHLTFVVDTSGSMKEQGRLELVKHAMRLLVNELDARDAIAVVAFSSDARMILPMTSAGQKALIESAIFPLSPDGSTNAAAGLLMGYTEALGKIDANSTNRVVLLSDGVANTGETDQDRMTDAVKFHREKGIYLNTIGVGMNNHNDVLLEQLADKGDGVCSYVDGADEARKSIVDRFTGAFETIARDVKIQVEFDPAQVDRYRLLGYENRAVADQDFRNDKVDAGEIGAGHQVTALYEIERAANASEKPLATVRLRWKAPLNVAAPTANEEANEIAKPVLAGQQTSFEGAGLGFRRAAVVAQFAEFLRRSVHARGDSLDDLIAEAEKLEKETRDSEVAELVALMRKSRQLILNALPGCDELCQTIESVRRNAILRCEADLLASADSRSRDELEEKIRTFLQKDGTREKLDRENGELELRIKELLRRKLEGSPK